MGNGASNKYQTKKKVVVQPPNVVEQRQIENKIQAPTLIEPKIQVPTVLKEQETVNETSPQIEKKNIEAESQKKIPEKKTSESTQKEKKTSDSTRHKKAPAKSAELSDASYDSGSGSEEETDSSYERRRRKKKRKEKRRHKHRKKHGRRPRTPSTSDESSDNSSEDSDVVDVRVTIPAGKSSPQQFMDLGVAAPISVAGISNKAQMQKERSAEDAIDIVLQSLPYYEGGANPNDQTLQMALISIPPQRIDKRDQEGSTVLLLVCQYGYEDLLMFIMQKGPNVNAINHTGTSALHYTCYESTRSFRNAELLLRYGANPKFAENNYGCTALHYAASGSSPSWQLCQLLVQYGANPAQADFQGMTAIDYARESGAYDCVRFLTTGKLPGEADDVTEECLGYWVRKIHDDGGYWENLGTGDTWWEKGLIDCVKELVESEGPVEEKTAPIAVMDWLEQQIYQAKLSDLFARYDPVQLIKINAMLQENHGKEEKLFRKLAKKLGPEIPFLKELDVDQVLALQGDALGTWGVDDPDDSRASTVRSLQSPVYSFEPSLKTEPDSYKEVLKADTTVHFNEQAATSVVPVPSLESKLRSLSESFEFCRKEENRLSFVCLSKFSDDMDMINEIKYIKKMKQPSGKILAKIKRLATVRDVGSHPAVLEKTRQLEASLNSLTSSSSEMKSGSPFTPIDNKQEMELRNKLQSTNQKLDEHKSEIKRLKDQISQISKLREDLQNQDYSQDQNPEEAKAKLALEIAAERTKQRNLEELIDMLQMNNSERDDKMKKIRQERAAKLEKLDADHEVEMTKLQNHYDNIFEKTQLDLSQELEKIRKAGSSEVTELEAQLKKFVDDIDSKLKEFKSKTKEQMDILKLASEQGSVAQEYLRTNESAQREAKQVQAQWEKQHNDVMREYQKRRQLQVQLEEMQGNVRLCVRVRPLNDGEIKRGCSQSLVKEGKNQVAIVEGPQKSWECDRVISSSHGEKDSQELFNEHLPPMGSLLADGVSCCMLIVGGTGAGSSYTMFGELPASRGAGEIGTVAGYLPRLGIALFGALADRSALFTSEVKVTFCSATELEDPLVGNEVGTDIDDQNTFLNEVQRWRERLEKNSDFTKDYFIELQVKSKDRLTKETTAAQLLVINLEVPDLGQTQTKTQGVSHENKCKIQSFLSSQGAGRRLTFDSGGPSILQKLTTVLCQNPKILIVACCSPASEQVDVSSNVLHYASECRGDSAESALAELQALKAQLEKMKGSQGESAAVANKKAPSKLPPPKRRAN